MIVIGDWPQKSLFCYNKQKCVAVLHVVVAKFYLIAPGSRFKTVSACEQTEMDNQDSS